MKTKETDAERRLSSCPFTVEICFEGEDESLCYWMRDRLRFFHYVYVRSPEAILSGVKCDCTT